jgi:serine/threonine protein phosphatase 1
MVTLGEARPPEGLRLYAVGDIHGEHEALVEIRSRLARDRAERPVPDWREVYLGDYIDRGPDSAGVIETLATAPEADRRVCLLGNHDAFLRDFLARPEPSALWLWLTNGGTTTLADYGIDATGDPRAESLHRALLRAMPEHHLRFVRGLVAAATFGDFAFVHAGIRPGVPWEEQIEDDLLWIREEFLGHPGPHERVVVHGHTPARRVEPRPARINVDTGAGKGGHLSAVTIEPDGRVGRLDPEGIAWLETLRR